MLKDRIDELHAADHTEQRPTSFSEMTRSLHVYKNLVVFERGRHVDRRAMRTRPDENRMEAEAVQVKRLGRSPGDPRPGSAT